VDTPGETGQGLLSALRALADSEFPKEVTVVRKIIQLSKKLNGVHDISNTNPASIFVLIKISSGDVSSYINVFPHYK